MLKTSSAAYRSRRARTARRSDYDGTRRAAWALGSAANVGSCRAAAEALDGNRDGGAFSLRCAELAVDADVDGRY